MGLTSSTTPPSGWRNAHCFAMKPCCGRASSYGRKPSKASRVVTAVSIKPATLHPSHPHRSTSRATATAFAQFATLFVVGAYLCCDGAQIGGRRAPRARHRRGRVHLVRWRRDVCHILAGFPIQAHCQGNSGLIL